MQAYMFAGGGWSGGSILLAAGGSVHVKGKLSTMRAANKRVEIGLHQRLLLYIERFSVDGDFFSLMKHINDDYIRFERTITSTIEREEKMAKVRCEWVIYL